MKHSDTTTSAASPSPGRGIREPTPIPANLRRRLGLRAASLRLSLVKPHEMLWLALALVFNLAWELAQLGFYDLSVMHTSVAYAVVHCTLGDGIITAVAYMIVVGVTRSRMWPYTNPWVGMAVMLLDHRLHRVERMAQRLSRAQLGLRGIDAAHRRYRSSTITAMDRGSHCNPDHRAPFQAIARYPSQIGPGANGRATL